MAGRFEISHEDIVRYQEDAVRTDVSEIRQFVEELLNDESAYLPPQRAQNFRRRLDAKIEDVLARRRP